MSRRLVVLCGAWIVLAAVGLPQEASGVSGPDAIAARQASLDMSSITFRTMGDAMKAGREANVSQLNVKFPLTQNLSSRAQTLLSCLFC